MKKSLLIFFLLPLTFSSFGQLSGGLSDVKDWSEHLPKVFPSFPSPNASSFQVFGQIPVSVFTGTPDIRIPLHEVEVGDIKLPIALAYHISNRRVHTMPSWVGLGWTLDAGGVITRNMRGGRDENSSPLPGLSIPNGAGSHPAGYMYNHYLWENPTAYQSNNLIGNVLDSRTAVCLPDLVAVGKSFDFLDHLPDEFSFNFLDYSGTFFYDRNTESFIVHSDHDIKIVYNPDTDRSSGQQIDNAMHNAMPLHLGFCQYNEYYITHFQLITPDGTTYDFGGLNAIELTQPRQDQSPEKGVTSAWFLTKITSAGGFEIHRNYERAEQICNLYPYYETMQYTMTKHDLDCDKDVRCPESHGAYQMIEGQVISPVYLKNITFATGEIRFERSASNALTYTPRDQSYRNPTASLHSRFYRNLNALWYKLDNIKIYSGNTPLKQFGFTYIHTSTERLKLSALQESALDAQGNPSESLNPYSFTYNPKLLPAFCNDGTDHWGYANGNYSSTYIGHGDGFYELKEPTTNPDLYLAEILENITYPTGGYTAFTYEPHDYFYRVSESRSTLEATGNQIAGGVRIKTIRSFNTVTDESTSFKEYHYRQFVNDGVHLYGANSTGILAGTPIYFHSIPHYFAQQGCPHIMFNSGLLVPFGEVSFGSHIGYSEVVEVEKSSTDTVVGYTVSEFTNFDQDVYGQSHMDMGLSGPTNSPMYNAKLFISGSRHYERGKITTQTLYSSKLKPVEKTDYRYTGFMLNSDAQYFYRTFDFYPNCSNRGYFINRESGLYLPFSLYLLESKTKIRFATSGEDTITTRLAYRYNDRRLLAEEIFTNSEGETLTTKIFYPDDFEQIPPSSTSNQCVAIAEMKKDKRYMINKPVEVRQTVNGSVIAGKIQTYGIYTMNSKSVVRPKFEYTFQATSPENVSSLAMFNTGADPLIPACYKQTFSFETFDSYGNIRSFKANDQIPVTILWGYNNTQPIAYIRNAAWSEVEAVLGSSTLQNLENSSGPEYIRLVLDILRYHSSMKNAHVTTYTYQLPFGVSSITDMSGTTTYYEYDNFGRLKSSKDHNFLILEQIHYNYKQP